MTMAHRFGYHKPVNDFIIQQHQDVRNKCLEVAEHFMDSIPDCRERSLAITKLEEAMFWANAGIARVGNYEFDKKPEMAVETAEVEPEPVVDETLERHQLEHTNIWITNVHPATRCVRPCSIHNRSDHHLREFPQHYREDNGLMERICPCGIGHPDPDDPKATNYVHGCCGIHDRPNISL